MSNREKDNDYNGVIAQLDATHRVIVRKLNAKRSGKGTWIVQIKAGEWRGWKYPLNKEGLFRIVVENGFKVPPTLFSLSEK